jgi:hypothetical protein
MSERQQITGIILCAALAGGLLLFFALMPLQRKREALEAENRQMQEDLAKGNYLMGELPLANRKIAVLDEGKRLAAEWQQSALQLSTFTNQTIQGTQDVSKIDYKVALFEVRESLVKKAAERGIRPNFELAIDEKVLSNEDARKRMLQLRAVEKVMDAALDLKVGRVETVEPLETVPHSEEVTGELFLEEYPVRIQYVGSIENVYAFIHMAFQPGRVFVCRRMKIEKESLQNPDRVRVDATLSALVFLRNVEEMAPPPRPVERSGRPMGF